MTAVCMTDPDHLLAPISVLALSSRPQRAAAIDPLGCLLCLLALLGACWLMS